MFTVFVSHKYEFFSVPADIDCNNIVKNVNVIKESFYGIFINRRILILFFCYIYSLINKLTNIFIN